MSPPVSTARPLPRCLQFLFRVAAALCVLAPLLVRGTVLNWPGAGWTAGAPGPGQTFSQNFTAVTPNDVTVRINNNGSSSSGDTWSGGYPAINSTKLTGGLSGVNGLQLYLTAESATSAFIRTTVTFSSPVTNLSFQIWDVDASSGQFIDKIFNIQGLAAGPTTVGPSSVTSAVPGFNSISGSGLSTVILGTATASDTTNNGTIDVSFLGPITQFSFDWSNTDPAVGAQAIALGPLTFTVVPEASTGPVATILCVIAVAAASISRRRRADSVRRDS